MPRINLLDKSISELIAAGEVIERPASAIKEMLENSIDSGASAITVEIRNGGISYIRITDNGSGIYPDDVKKAFLRHATSKIKQADDLHFISTLGFRGEALASIAAVSMVTMYTKTADSSLGIKYEISGGEEIDCDQAGCADGTSIIVKNLFYNVPARLKFLKTDTAEANAVCAIVEKLALSHPEVSFKLISDKKQRVFTPGDNNLLSAVAALYGGNIADDMINVGYKSEGISVMGCISKPECSRATRSMQHFFVNDRYIKSGVCFAAIEEGYKNSIMIGKYPMCILDIKMPYNDVDVNVHPAKTEVKFANDKAVFNAIYFAVKSALSNNDILKEAVNKAVANFNPVNTFKNEESQQIKITNNSNENKNTLTDLKTVPLSSTGNKTTEQEVFKNMNLGKVTVASSKAEYSANANTFSSDKTSNTNDNASKDGSEECFSFLNSDSFRQNIAEEKQLENPVAKFQNDSIEKPDISADKTPEDCDELNVKIIGELFSTYLIFECGSDMMLMDKHAAHERIIYEKLKKTIDTKQSQFLLKPIVIVVSPEENQLISDNSGLISDAGFEVEEFGHNSVIIRSVPLILAEFDIQDIFFDMISKIASNKHDISSNIFENMLHSIACRSAIKANDKTTPEELKALLKEVITNGEIRHCPHGRPIVISFSKGELEKKFGRIQ